jgi:hypothetical protein
MIIEGYLMLIVLVVFIFNLIRCIYWWLTAKILFLGTTNDEYYFNVNGLKYKWYTPFYEMIVRQDGKIMPEFSLIAILIRHNVNKIKNNMKVLNRIKHFNPPNHEENK